MYSVADSSLFFIVFPDGTAAAHSMPAEEALATSSRTKRASWSAQRAASRPLTTVPTQLPSPRRVAGSLARRHKVPASRLKTDGDEKKEISREGFGNCMI